MNDCILDSFATTRIVVGVITVSSLAFDQHRVDGLLNQDIVAADPEMGNISDDSWHAYGRSNLGQRYSPLDQITAENGSLDLMHNMPFKQDGYYYSTSPPVVANGLVVVAGAVNDNYDINSPSGVIRAYDARTGKLKWNWDPDNPQSTEPIADGETYSTSSPNSWAVASADEDLGLIYFPMGNRFPV